MEKKTNQTIFSIFSLLLLFSSCVSAQLRTGFYQNSCPNVETIVRNAVRQKFQQTFVTAPATLRLFFHDCFVRGCDASILIASPSEKDHPDDMSLAGDGFDTVVKAKQAVDRDPKCRNKVSCADILALATREVVVLVRNHFIRVQLTRDFDPRLESADFFGLYYNSKSYYIEKYNFNSYIIHELVYLRFYMYTLLQDNLLVFFPTRMSLFESGSYPRPHNKHFLISGKFSKKKLGIFQFIVSDFKFLGAHTLGFAHCGKFSNRIYNFSPRTRIDPSLNSGYALQLRQMCPQRVDPRIAINMDPTTPRTFDNAYFKNLQQGKGLFTSDQVLFTDQRSRATVNSFANSETAFRQAFVSAITKLGRVGVKTGNAGEIRRDCSRFN
ncbi:hypothetical protein HID58_012948 [Brassica napus]|uniref:Peroxidase n=1 Tax=Brassica napus TaxID=3708 RepID=A0ABQ8E2J6_BRANA|nr:hypothetical protein HID58_012948 [Brassica napus]